jgi:hypothetical protein
VADQDRLGGQRLDDVDEVVENVVDSFVSDGLGVRP